MSEPSSPKPTEPAPASTAESTGAAAAAGSEGSPAGFIEVTVNGEPRRIAAGATITALLAELGLADRRVAVERNREVVPRAEHARAVLAAGDRLELVTFVGGG
jgi:sulfur carrier protein